jgi:hypothetical protein
MSVLSLTTTYNHSIDFLTARSLGKLAVRKRLRRLDSAAFAAVGLVAIGLVLEDHSIGGWAASLRIDDWTLSAENAGRLVTLGVSAEFVLHWLHVRATKREQQLADAESSEQQQEIAVLSKETAEANQRAAEAWEKVAWRTLTDEKRAALIEKLSPLAGTPFVVVLACIEGEAANFAWRVADVLDDAGWLRRGPFPYTVGDDTMRRMHAVWNGLQIDSNFAGRGAWPERPDEEQRLICVTVFLAETFRDAGFEAIPIGVADRIGPTVPEPPDSSLIRIRVCRKLF